MLLQNQDVCLLFLAAQMELQSALNAAQGEAGLLTTGAMIKSGMICPTKSMLDDMASISLEGITKTVTKVLIQQLQQSPCCFSTQQLFNWMVSVVFFPVEEMDLFGSRSRVSCKISLQHIHCVSSPRGISGNRSELGIDGILVGDFKPSHRDSQWIFQLRNQHISITFHDFHEMGMG